MGIILCVVVFLHKHRWIVFRRFTAIIGTGMKNFYSKNLIDDPKTHCFFLAVFLLRCVTMLVTSLSVPSTHLKCDVRVGATPEEKLAHAWRVSFMRVSPIIVMTRFSFILQRYSLTLGFP